MTQTLRRPPRRDPNVRRKGACYLFKTLRVHESGPKVGLVLDGSVEDGYVGKTRQTLAQREQQHRGGSADGEQIQGEDIEEQPWWEITVGGIQLLEQGFWTDTELAAKEVEWIHRVKPRYNYVDNLANENRIPKFTAREHRDTRDRARGLQPRQWQPFSTQRRTVIDPVKPRQSARRPASSWSRRTKTFRRRCYWALAWLGSVLGLWLALVLLAASLTVPWPVLPDVSAGLVSAAYVPMLQKRRRKTAWALIALTTIVLAAWAAQGS